MADKVQRPLDFRAMTTSGYQFNAYSRIEVDDFHASLIDLIDKTQSCTSGLSFGECLDEIKRRLGE